MGRGKKEGGKGFNMSSDVSWVRGRSGDCENAVKASKNFWTEMPSKSLLFPKQNSHLGRSRRRRKKKVFHSSTFSAMGDLRAQRPVRCKVPQEAWARRVNEPTFSIIPVSVFMGEKLITCDKYNSAWTGCRFCQAACEQKHFSNVVILAVNFLNQRPVHRHEWGLEQNTRSDTCTQSHIPALPDKT